MAISVTLRTTSKCCQVGGQGIEPGGVDLSGFPLFGLFNGAMGTTTVIPDMDASRPASVDPENTTDTDLRCLRSGSFHSVPSVSRSSQRARWVGPKQVRYNYGIRVIVAADK